MRSSKPPSRVAASRRARRRGQRGVGLVMVLGALTVLTVMLTEFQDETSAELSSALAARDALRAEYAAHSAVNLARLLVAAEPEIRKTLAPLFMMMKRGPPQIPVWDFAEPVLGAFNDAGGGEKFQALASVKLEEGRNLGLPGASFEIRVVDEDSKINLNTAWRDPLTQNRLAAELLGLVHGPQFDPLFDERDADGQFSDRQQVCGAIIDWVDGNQDLNGCDPTAGVVPNAAPEDNFYQLLDAPYPRKDAPFDSLEELRLARGVGDDFWSTFVEPDPEDPTQRNVTIWGQGKVNVNTANAQTLLALVCGGTRPLAKVCTDLAEQMKFLALVHVIRQLGAGAPIFSSPRGFLATLKQRSPLGQFLKAFGLEPIQFFSESEARKAVTTSSRVFSFYATGHARTGKRETRARIHAVVDYRGAPKIPRLSAAAALAAGAPAAPDPASLPPGATEGAILGTLEADPAGRIVYFRLD